METEKSSGTAGQAMDEELSEHLTRVARGVPGVTYVFHAAPAVAAAAQVIAAGLTLRSPDALVEIDRADDFATVRAHVGTTVGRRRPRWSAASGRPSRRPRWPAGPS